MLWNDFELAAARPLAVFEGSEGLGSPYLPASINYVDADQTVLPFCIEGEAPFQRIYVHTVELFALFL
jgi:hypothetical protein